MVGETSKDKVENDIISLGFLYPSSCNVLRTLPISVPKTDIGWSLATPPIANFALATILSPFAAIYHGQQSPDYSVHRRYNGLAP